MPEFDFSLIYEVPADLCPDELLCKLAKTGCEEAFIVTCGTSCSIALIYAREATSLNAACDSAIADVEREIPNARFSSFEYEAS